MRLTLRTLLAYLDDTLEPTKAKAIGQKIADNPTAQEIISRIKEVVRRRRLTVPPATGPGAKLDPNTIAEYIDSVLPAEQLAEVEEVCLGSDLYLAEIAACHQILTVILSEPSLVPPTARQRMYGIVKGPEAIPYRKVSRGADREMAVVGAHSDRDEADETLLLGLPFYSGRGSWFRPLIPAAVLLLLVVGLVAAIWNALPSNAPVDRYRTEGQVARADNQATNGGAPPVVKPSEPGDAKVNTVPKNPPAKPPNETPAPPPPILPAKPSETPTKPPETTQPKSNGKTPVPPPPGPNDQPVQPPPVQPVVKGERKPVGKYLPPTTLNADPNVLLARTNEATGWKRVFRTDPIYTEDELVGLPGYQSKVNVDGVDLFLLGNLPIGTLPVIILESAVVLHAPSDAQVDLTLDHGWAAVANARPNGPAKVRLRFQDEDWLLTLQDPGSKVAVCRFGIPRLEFALNPPPDNVPFAGLVLLVLNGHAYLKVRGVEQLIQQGGQTCYYWDNADPGRGPKLLNRLPPWAELPARPRDARMMQTLANLDRSLLNRQASVDVVLSELLKEQDLNSQILSVYCLGAVNDLPNLLEALANPDQREVRLAAVQVLRHWIGRRPDNEAKLYEALKKKYEFVTAKIIMDLLHTYSDVSRRQPDTFDHLIEWLRSDKLPIRQLADWHLSLLPETKALAATIQFDPTGDTEQRDRAYKKWKELVPMGKLPPASPPAKKK